MASKSQYLRMMYTHMPFLINEKEMLLCVGTDVNQRPYRPWKMALKKGEEIREIDFPSQKISYRNRHCSPVEENGYLSVTYGGRVFHRSATGWVENITPVQQGYFDGNALTFCINSDLFHRGEKIQHPFSKLLRVVPSELGIIVTGSCHLSKWSAVLTSSGWKKITSEEKPVYKCHIKDGILAHAVWHGVGIECYKVETTNQFALEQLDSPIY